MMLSEPAMWFYLLDPESLALIVIIGVQYTRLEIGILALRVRGELARCVPGGALLVAGGFRPGDPVQHRQGRGDDPRGRRRARRAR